MAIKAIALFSGGLDSYLAAFLIREQGVEVEAVKFRTIFGQAEMTDSGSENDEIKALSNRGIKLQVLSLGKEWLDLVARPLHSRGRNMNPCIDCRILMLKRARQHMLRAGASFVITGEVLGQRPLSQNVRALGKIELASGLTGILLRPLSALLLPETDPEKWGYVNRGKLLAIKGRGRKEQFMLARRYGLEKPPTPAGGCLLTDSAYSERLRSVLDDRRFLSEHLARIIRHGRFFRLSVGCFLMVGRNERENGRLVSHLKPGDWLLEPENCAGPVGLGVGRPKPEDVIKAAEIVARYSDRPSSGGISVAIRRGAGGKSKSLMIGL